MFGLEPNKSEKREKKNVDRSRFNEPREVIVNDDDDVDDRATALKNWSPSEDKTASEHGGAAVKASKIVINMAKTSPVIAKKNMSLDKAEDIWEE